MYRKIVLSCLIILSLLLGSCAQSAVPSSSVESAKTAEDSGNFYDEVDLSGADDSPEMDEILSTFLWMKDAAFVYTTLDPVTNTCRTILSTYDSSGTFLREWDLSSLYKEQYEFVSNVTADNSGVLHVISYRNSDGSCTYSLDTLSEDLAQITASVPLRLPEGFSPEEFLFVDKGRSYVKEGDSVLSISADGSSSSLDLPSVISLACINGTAVAVTCQAIDKADVLSIIPLIENQAGAALGSVSLPHSAESGLCFSNGDLYYSDQNAIYQIGINGGTDLRAVRLVQYKDTGLSVSAGELYRTIFAFSPDCILYRSMLDLSVSPTDFTTKSQVVLLKRTDEKKAKTTVTIGGPGISYDTLLLSAISSFNRENDEYQVKIQDYTLPDASSSDPDSLTVDILAGSAPDILYSSGQSLDNYIAGNRAISLASVFSPDVGNDKSLFWSNILALCEQNGQPVQIIPWFTMSGLIGEKSSLQQAPGLSIDRVRELKTELPDASSLVFGNLSSQQLLLYSVFSDLSQFVNYANSSADFQSKTFYDLLTFAKDFGSESNVDEDELLQARQLLFKNVRQLGDPLTFGALYTNFASEPIITGYPTVSGGSAVCIPGCALSVRTDANNPDACVELLSFLLSEKVQDDATNAGQIPLRISSLEKRLHALESTATSDVDPLPAEAAAAFLSNISSITHASRMDTRIYAIIVEEAAPYFAGDKTADAAAASIQSRVQLLLDEN